MSKSFAIEKGKVNGIIEVGNSYFPTNYFEGGNMKKGSFVNDAKVMSKGQVTIPKDVRAALGVETGDRVTFIVEGTNVRVINSAEYALQQFQAAMKGKANKAGFISEEDVAEWITKSRRMDNK